MTIEFFLDKTGTVTKAIYLKWDNQDWQKLSDLTPIQIEMIFDKVAKDMWARKAFMHLAKFKQFNNKREILERFILCNWTKLDNHMDIANRKLQFENVSCPFKSGGNCPYNGKGIICIKQ